MQNNKITLLIIILAGVTCFSSCKKWLDVNPATQVRDENQFSSQQGFVDALAGIYQQAADQRSYGEHLSFGLLDVLAQRYENKSSTTASFYGHAARYEYMNTGGSQMNVRGTIDAIWVNNYEAIAQANFVLANIEDNKSVLSPSAYNIIKGEALGMRAFLHYDLIRLFAPALLDGSNSGSPAIPYVDEFSVTPSPRLTLGAALDKVEADLKAAEELLAVHQDIDQISGNQGNTSLDLFLMYRQNHLNYWAVKASLARLNLYRNNKPEALRYATEVINSNKFIFTSPSNINNDENTNGGDLTFTSEHIFSIYVSNLKTVADSRFRSNAGDPFALGNYTDNTDYFSNMNKLNTMYEMSVAGYGTEVRMPQASKRLWNIFSNNVVYTKKYYADMVTNVKQRLVPLIRLSEMYYIAAEASTSPADGVEYLNVVRTARAIPELPLSITETELAGEIEKEYRKEFYAEGQLWFFYKRKNTSTIPDGVGNPMTPEKYLFPYPDDEIEFGK